MFKLLFQAIMVTSALFVVLVPIIGPTLQKERLKHQVTSRIFEIRGSEFGHGGTGFQVEATKGPLIVTNSHVCELSEKDSSLIVKRDDRQHTLKILKMDEQSDLCLVEGWPNLKGLKLGDEPTLGDKVNIVGHPNLGPVTLTSGEVAEVMNVQVLHHIITLGGPDAGVSDLPCDLPKNEIKKEERHFMNITLLGDMKSCMVNEKDAIHTDAEVHPGSSGSPVFDESGNVVGVVFAFDTNTNWGYVVNLKNLKRVLKDY